MENVKKIFISYSHQNRTVCEWISGFLERREGFSVWYDKGLIPGEVYRRKIASVIRETDYFIILISGASVRSEWVQDEVEYAKKCHRRILPIWIEDTEIPDELDMILQRYHSLFWHLRSSDGQFEQSLLAMFGTGDAPSGEGQALVGFGNEFSENVNRNMRSLLAMEQQARFSECYAPDNAVTLGMAYLFGGPCPVDRQKARHYFRSAAYNGNQDGEFYLLQMKLEDQATETWDDPDEQFCRPVIKQIAQIADGGSIPAKLYLGNLFWQGKYGCSEDKVRSAALYEECARRGNARAQFVMSSNYYYGDGVEADYDLAVMYANLALEQKYIYAWRRWGKFYRDGLAVEQDYAKARECYEKGAQMGDYNCYNKIGDMLYHGWGGPVDYEAAVSYFRKGGEAPSFGQRYSIQRAKTALGRAYENGQGVEKDVAAAAEEYLEGYNNGSLECRDAYLRCSRQVQETPDETAEKTE